MRGGPFCFNRNERCSPQLLPSHAAVLPFLAAQRHAQFRGAVRRKNQRRCKV